MILALFLQVYSGGFVDLFCPDLPGTSIDQDFSSYPHYTAAFTVGSLKQLSISGRFSNTENEALAILMMRWVVDNHYLTNFLQPVNDQSIFAWRATGFPALGRRRR